MRRGGRGLASGHTGIIGARSGCIVSTNSACRGGGSCEVLAHGNASIPAKRMLPIKFSASCTCKGLPRRQVPRECAGTNVVTQLFLPGVDSQDSGRAGSVASKKAKPLRKVLLAVLPLLHAAMAMGVTQTNVILDLGPFFFNLTNSVFFTPCESLVLRRNASIHDLRIYTRPKTVAAWYQAHHGNLAMVRS